ncbi:rnhA operon protein [Natronorubrum sp. JWXQ-INN-674]|uniref:RnhA operon protein n=1 Tax=Natronorubrum halalkaliphilum TaxID=2691917 RepID=A0A6B0VK36_9EURY|nr:rnhA operon protein [Natronorubrum halalkaliphilum]MXV61467.1 rnhA operon protein [Natronorubrum halalkaliphilum]
MSDSNDPRAGSDHEADGSGNGVDDAASADLPDDVVDEAERLTRLERTAPEDAEAKAHLERRAALLEAHDFTARIRDDGDDVLVLHPEEWHDEAAGVIRTDRIDDISRAVEIPLEGAGDPDDWEAVDSHNRDLVARVRERHGDVHGDNAALLADFVGNHYAKQIPELTSEELAEFRSEYFVRNAWPSDEQQDVINESITLIFEAAEKPVPELQDR